MAIRLLASWQDYPAGAFVYRDSAFEVKMVQQGLASFDLSGGFHWPLPQVEGTIGPLSSVSMLSQYPPGLYLGFTAIAGGGVYVSNGAEWKEISTESIVWDDLRFPVQGINPAGSASPPTVDDTVFPGTLLFGHTKVNVIAGIAQMPHAWFAESAIHPHIHWAKTSAAAGGVMWEWCYSVANLGDVFGPYSSWLPCTEAVPNSDINAKHAIARFPELSMAGKRESAIIAWQLRRNPLDAGDIYATDARLFEFDLHYQSNKRGTLLEIPI